MHRTDVGWLYPGNKMVWDRDRTISLAPVTYSLTGALGLPGCRDTSVDIILRSAVKGYCLQSHGVGPGSRVRNKRYMGLHSVPGADSYTPHDHNWVADVPQHLDLRGATSEQRGAKGPSLGRGERTNARAHDAGPGASADTHTCPTVAVGRQLVHLQALHLICGLCIHQ